MDIGELQRGELISGSGIDASKSRERARQRRLLKLCITLAIPATWLWYRLIVGNPVKLGIPPMLKESPELGLSIGLMLLLIMIIAVPMLGSGRSPHVFMHPSKADVKLSDVVGAEQTKREAIDTLNLFLAHKTFSEELGGSPRRGVLFEGPPGTGKTYLAKAMAGEAGVPFLFVSASAFQSMYFGQTNKKVRSFFKALRKAARAEGGAIGFIEEFDAIGGSRSDAGGGMREGVVGVVNELLVQMQSFDMPMGWEKFVAKWKSSINRLLPPSHQIPIKAPKIANVLIVAATNRAADLDPALLRPGRFDRLIHFDLPPHGDRVAIANYYLSRKAHHPSVNAEFIADLSGGYSPVRIERLMDEALVIALRGGRRQMSIDDVLQAQMVTEIGLAHEVGYHPEERRRIAVHEAGHALVAQLVGREIRVASILRRAGSLGLVAHDDADERFLRTPTEMKDLITVALAGRSAEAQEFGEASNGIASDLAAATQLACQMVGALGGGTGLMSLEAASMPVAGNLVAKVMSDEASRLAAESMLRDAANRADSVVREHRVSLLAIAGALLERDELSGDDIRAIVSFSQAAEADRLKATDDTPSKHERRATARP